MNSILLRQLHMTQKHQHKHLAVQLSEMCYCTVAGFLLNTKIKHTFVAMSSCHVLLECHCHVIWEISARLAECFQPTHIGK